METERAALVETLRAADPDAPTLCAGWTVRHLAAHLLQREQQPVRAGLDAAAVHALRIAAPGREPFLRPLAERARTPEGYAALVDRFAAGPGAWAPMGRLGDAVHLLEYLVHHEDVRRADPAAEPRVLPADEVRAIWHHLRRRARLLYRASPVGVVLAVPGGPRALVRGRPDAVVLWGDPVELALHGHGRTEVADVTVEGREDTVERFEAWLG